MTMVKQTLLLQLHMAILLLHNLILKKALTMTATEEEIILNMVTENMNLAVMMIVVMIDMVQEIMEESLAMILTMVMITDLLVVTPEWMTDMEEVAMITELILILDILDPGLALVHVLHVEGTVIIPMIDVAKAE